MVNFDDQPLTANERKITKNYYENTLQGHEILWKLIDVDDRIVAATEMACVELRSRRGDKDCFKDFGEDGKLTAKWISLRRYIAKLYTEEKGYNGFRAISPGKVAKMMEEAAAKERESER